MITRMLISSGIILEYRMSIRSSLGVVFFGWGLFVRLPVCTNRTLILDDDIPNWRSVMIWPLASRPNGHNHSFLQELGYRGGHNFKGEQKREGTAQARVWFVIQRSYSVRTGCTAHALYDGLDIISRRQLCAPLLILLGRRRGAQSCRLEAMARPSYSE